LRSFIKGVSRIEENSIEENPATNYRCAFCYRLRLEKTARYAAENGCDAFSTTLLISPYQNHELIKEIAGELAVLYKVQFLYRDFRPRFREGQREARKAGYYMQKYCGCIYSEEERYLGGKT
jgi:predicted adenine nucleotide alpha hydrolase (AANH) superfamily ATPase